MSGLYAFLLLVIVVSRLIMDQTMVMSEREMKDTDVYGWYLAGTWAILFPLLAAAGLLNLNQSHPIIGALLASGFIYQGYMQWRYIRETNRHKVSMILAAICLFFTLLLVFLKIKEG